jgi:hypothetical protein
MTRAMDIALIFFAAAVALALLWWSLRPPDDPGG